MQKGERIAGRFEIEGEISSGGMGRIYRGRDRSNGEPVAIKLMRRDVGTDVRRFMREAAILASLDHPGVVRYVSHGLTPAGDPFLVMQWLDGTSLGETLRTRGLSLAATARLGERIGAALGSAHAAGVVHRDVKPSNIILEAGDPARAALIDFGIAAGGGKRLTATGVIFGTPSYMPPEQVRGERELQPQSDVFALGAVLYECLTGRPAFPGENYRAIQVKVLWAVPPPLPPTVPPRLGAVVRRMLAKKPADRPPDGAAVARALAALEELDDRGTAAAALPSEEPTSVLERPTGAFVLVEGADLDAITEAIPAPPGARLEDLGYRGIAASLVDDDPEAAARYAAALSAACPSARVAVAVDDDLADAADRAAEALSGGARGRRRSDRGTLAVYVDGASDDTGE